MTHTRRKIAGSVSPQTFSYLEEMIASHRVENVGEAFDLAIKSLQREDSRRRNGHAAPYSEVPSAEEIAQDRFAVRAMHDSNPDMVFDD